MNELETSQTTPPVVWIRGSESAIDVTAFADTSPSGLCIVDGKRAQAAIDALRGHPMLQFGLVVIESSCEQLEAICQAVGALEPAPRIVMLYPHLRVLGPVLAMPRFNESRHLGKQVVGF